MKKVVSDRRASLDEETEIKPAMRSSSRRSSGAARASPIVAFPADGAEVPDTPRLTLVVADPEVGVVGRRLVARSRSPSGRSSAESRRGFIRARSSGASRSPAGTCARRWSCGSPGSGWRKEVAEGTLGGEFDRTDRAELQSKVTDAEEAAKDEVWGGYRFAVIADRQEA